MDRDTTSKPKKQRRNPKELFGIICPKCESRKWKMTHRCPLDPANDKFRCECGHTWKRYD